jgi:hypothetical protein
MTIMDRGAMALNVYKKVTAAGGCAMFDEGQLSLAATVCTLKRNHDGAHRFEDIARVLFTFDGSKR